MKKQNQIKRTLSQPNNIAYIKELLADKDIKNHTQLAKQVCKHFEFYDHRGQMQIASCTDPLRKLESTRYFKEILIKSNYFQLTNSSGSFHEDRQNRVTITFHFMKNSDRFLFAEF